MSIAIGDYSNIHFVSLTDEQLNMMRQLYWGRVNEAEREARREVTDMICSIETGGIVHCA